jgi:hypothetical protein
MLEVWEPSLLGESEKSWFVCGVEWVGCRVCRRREVSPKIQIWGIYTPSGRLSDDVAAEPDDVIDGIAKEGMVVGRVFFSPPACPF